MQPSFQLLGTSFGAVLFLYCLARMIYGMRFAQSRDERLEAVGLLVPGIAGLLLAGAFWVPHRWVAILLMLVAIACLVAGRAVYELIVFHGSNDNPNTH